MILLLFFDVRKRFHSPFESKEGIKYATSADGKIMKSSWINVNGYRFQAGVGGAFFWGYSPTVVGKYSLGRCGQSW